MPARSMISSTEVAAKPRPRISASAASMIEVLVALPSRGMAGLLASDPNLYHPVCIDSNRFRPAPLATPVFSLDIAGRMGIIAPSSIQTSWYSFHDGGSHDQDGDGELRC